MPKKILSTPVTWLSEKISNSDSNDPITLNFYKKFRFRKIEAGLGDYVLVSNVDSLESDTEEGCYVAQILTLYENPEKKSDPYRAKVQWYSRPSDLPKEHRESINFVESEVLEDHRPFDNDVSIETFFKKCNITMSATKIDTDIITNETARYHYVCRYRITPISKRKVDIEPVLEEERKAVELLRTPTSLQKNSFNCPNKLTVRLERMSLSGQDNWCVSRATDSKLLLKRAIFTDKSEKNYIKLISPKKTPTRERKVMNTPKSNKDLEDNSDDDEMSLSQYRLKIRTPARFDDITPTISTNSPRKSRRLSSQINYHEGLMATPKKSVSKRIFVENSDEEFEPTPRTPRTPKNRTPSVRTPKSSVKKVSQLTPTLHTRAHSIEYVEDFIRDDKSLPGREEHLESILSFVRTCILDETSGCMYVSGVPGTGKTATVCSALQILKNDPDLPNFHLVEVNGMKIAEPRQIYVQINKELTGKTVSWEQAYSLLETRFTNPGTRRIATVLLVDELDALCTRRQHVLYSIMHWATHNCAMLTVLAVSNTMDLPERGLVTRVASRLGVTRLIFLPYTHTELQKIVASRLTKANVTADAVQLIARKVAAVSGDARRALSLCARTLELGGAGGAGLGEVQRALAETSTSAVVRAIRNCSPAERLMLRAIDAEVLRTSSDETTLPRVLSTAAAILSLDGRPYRAAVSVRAPTPAQAHTICARLAASKLILMEPKAAEPRLILNVSSDDIHYATT